MKEILLRPYYKGYKTLVDDDLYEQLSQGKWHYRNGYAARPYRVGGAGSTQRSVFLHRLINETPDGLFTDHINGDKLDNRRSNLRTVTLAQNNMNMGKKLSNQAPYLGVSWWKRDNNWKAAIRYDDKNHNLGYYDTPEHAALVYNYYARKYRGEYARLNEIPEKVMPKEQQEAFLTYWLANRHLKGDNKSGARGVSWYKSIQKWVGSVTYRGKSYHLGSFDDKMEAAKAYNKKALELFGERAILNPS